MTRKLTGERRKHARFHAQEGVWAFFKSRSGQVLDISMGGVAFCCPKRNGAEGNGGENGLLLTLAGSIRLEGLPVSPVSQSDMEVVCKTSQKKKKLTRYSFKFGGLSPHQSMLLNHFIRTHSQEKCEFSMLYC